MRERPKIAVIVNPAAHKGGAAKRWPALQAELVRRLGPFEPRWQLFVDWLAANPAERADYLAVKREAERRAGGEIASYVAVKEPWYLGAYRRAWEWADSTGWQP